MKKFVFVAITIIVSLLILSCSSPTRTPAQTTEPEIPAHFSTYTSEGLYSISYPPDWTPALSIMETLWEDVKEWMESVDPEVDLEEIQLLFCGGVPYWGGYYPNVSIGIMPRSTGYWSLDEIVESEYLYDMVNTPGYREISRVRTVVDGREAIIIDCEDNEPGFGRWRYLQLVTVQDDFVWMVTCSCEYQDFNDYADTFESVVRSLRILN